MRYRRSLHLATRVALLSIFLGSPVAAHQQSSVEQPASALPKSWNDAVAQLADKIAASVSPSTPVTLDVKNISSLDESNAGTIENAFQSSLRAHSFNVVSSNSASAQTATQLHLTLSESADSFIWVAEIPGKSPDSDPSLTSIVSVPRNGVTDDAPDSQYLSLEKRFIWKQPERFLDFAVLKNSASAEETLLVLETNRAVFYKVSNSGGELSRSIAIPEVVPRSRTPQGEINLQEKFLSVGELKCLATPDFDGKLDCNSKVSRSLVLPSHIPGRPESLGTTIHGACRGDGISFFTGDGDWTQTDSIQGYLIKASAMPMVPSGSPIQFNGPVIYLHPDSDVSSVRAVVHNLKTGNYEAYIVTATCSH